MRALRLTSAARRDIAALLAESEERFGSRAADAYQTLLDAAFLDLRTNPERPTVKGRTGVAPAYRFHHLRHSRRRAEEADRVNRPRHIIVFNDDGQRVTIIRVLHDAMDIEGRLRDTD